MHLHFALRTDCRPHRRRRRRGVPAANGARVRSGSRSLPASTESPTLYHRREPTHVKAAFSRCQPCAMRDPGVVAEIFATELPLVLVRSRAWARGCSQVTITSASLVVCKRGGPPTPLSPPHFALDFVRLARFVCPACRVCLLVPKRLSHHCNTRSTPLTPLSPSLASSSSFIAPRCPSTRPPTRTSSSRATPSASSGARSRAASPAQASTPVPSSSSRVASSRTSRCVLSLVPPPNEG